MAETLLQRGTRWLREKNQTFNAVQLTYVRKDSVVQVGPFPAQIGGTTELQEDFDDLVASTARQADFLIPQEHLVERGQPFTPAAGDRIFLVETNKTRIYRLAPIEGERAYDLMDHHGESPLRVHGILETIQLT